MECKICKLEFTEPAKFHRHLSSHKMNMERYYHQFYPRFDLLTRDPILFKSYDWYFSSLFNTRANMVSYFKQNPDDQGATIRRLLKLRKKRKNLTVAPSTVDARTCILPTPSLVNKMGFDYNIICESEGLTPRFDYSIKEINEKIPEGFEITRDTREQLPIEFGAIPIRIEKNDFGDYVSLSHFHRIGLERKSMADLCGTLSQGYERFQKELTRAKEMRCNLVVIVEEPIEELVNLSHSRLAKFTKASGEFICSRVREITQSFQNVQFLFLKNRKEMSVVIPQILLYKGDFNATDYQYIYDIGGLSTRLSV